MFRNKKRLNQTILIVYRYFWCLSMSSASKISANSSLDKIEESLMKFINSLDEAFELLELIFDDQGNVIDYLFVGVNFAYEKLTGLKAADVVGKRKEEVAPVGGSKVV